MYYHGYREEPVAYDPKQPGGIASNLAAAGYLVAQSAYSVTGWALEQAIPETEALRKYTIAHYGMPKETYVTGHSMGGQLTIATIERYPNRYDGALPLCGLLTPASQAFAARRGDGRGVSLLLSGRAARADRHSGVGGIK